MAHQFDFPSAMMNRGNMNGIDMQNLPLVMRYARQRGGFGRSGMGQPPGPMDQMGGGGGSAMPSNPFQPSPPPAPPQAQAPQSGQGGIMESQIRSIAQSLGLPDLSRASMDQTTGNYIPGAQGFASGGIGDIAPLLRPGGK